MACLWDSISESSSAKSRICVCKKGGYFYTGGWKRAVFWVCFTCGRAPWTTICSCAVVAFAILHREIQAYLRQSTSSSLQRVTDVCKPPERVAAALNNYDCYILEEAVPKKGCIFNAKTGLNLCPKSICYSVKNGYFAYLVSTLAAKLARVIILYRLHSKSLTRPSELRYIYYI